MFVAPFHKIKMGCHSKYYLQGYLLETGQTVTTFRAEERRFSSLKRQNQFQGPSSPILQGTEGSSPGKTAGT